jgi:hypothetical protein
LLNLLGSKQASFRFQLLTQCIVLGHHRLQPAAYFGNPDMLDLQPIGFLPFHVDLGKSWACKHWKFQNTFFVIFLHFCCIFFAFGFVILDSCCHFFVFFVISLSFLCHFCHLFVILLSFYCHFGNGKMEKKNDYHDRPFVISWQHQIQGTSAETLGKPAGGEEG